MRLKQLIKRNDENKREHVEKSAFFWERKTKSFLSKCFFNINSVFIFQNKKQQFKYILGNPSLKALSRAFIDLISFTW